MNFDDVKAYIDSFILNAEAFDKSDDIRKMKAVNNAESLLYMLFRNYNPVSKPLPVEAIAYQTVWMLSKDATIKKAEMGIASISIEGMTQTFQQMDRTIAPEVKRILKKRVGSYGVNVLDTRRGVYFD